MEIESIFKFFPNSSFVHADFWHKLAENKLDIDKLNDSVKSIYGFYTNSNTTHCISEIDCTAFNE